MSLNQIRSLLESNSGDIKYTKKKSIDILTDVEDKLGSIKAILGGLEGYVESLELFYKENKNNKSVNECKYLLSDIDELKTKIDFMRISSGQVLNIKKRIKNLKG